MITNSVVTVTKVLGSVVGQIFRHPTKESQILVQGRNVDAQVVDQSRHDENHMAAY